MTENLAWLMAESNVTQTSPVKAQLPDKDGLTDTRWKVGA